MSSEKEAKLKALQLTLDKLDKAYGKGTVMRLSVPDKKVFEETLDPFTLLIEKERDQYLNNK